MKILLILTRVYLLRLLDINKLRHGNDKKATDKARNKLVGAVLIAALMLFNMYNYFNMMGQAFATLGIPEAILYMACVAAFAITVITTMLTAGRTLVNFKDYDAVMSLPVSQRTVVASRMAQLYITDMAFSLMVMLPAGAVYAQYAAPGAGFYIGFIVTLLFMPLLPLTAAGVLGILINAATVGFRKKNIAQIILSFALFAGIMYFSMSSSSAMEDMENLGPIISRSICRMYPIAQWYGDGLSGNAGLLALFIGINAIAMALFVLAVGYWYRPLHALLTRKARGRTERKGNAANRVRTPFAALYKKDFSRYMSSALYVTNTSMGLLLLLIGGVALLVLKEKAAQMLSEPGLGTLVVSLIPFAPSMFMALSCTTNASFSIEREKLWQMSVLPVLPRDVLKAKLAVNLVMALPALLVSWVLIMIALKPSAAVGILTLLTPLAYLLFIAMLGLKIDLSSPKLNWTNEQEIIKQGLNVFITIFGGMLLVAAPAALIAMLLSDYAIPFTAAVAALLYLGALLLWRSTNKRAADKLRA